MTSEGVRDLAARLARFDDGVAPGTEPEAREAVAALRDALEAGIVRAAERGDDGTWRVHTWVKRGILLGFRVGTLAAVPGTPAPFFDKDTWPPRALALADGVRLVPGGSAIRRGAYVAPGVVCMPPMYVNVGAHVDAGAMIDSHALVGTCAQVGRRVHLGAGAQLGGVIEPAGALPVIVEDDAFIGGGCGIYEGTIVRAGAVLAPGVQLSGGTVVVDLVRDAVYRREGDHPLEIPAGAVVVPGTRPVRHGPGARDGIALYTPVIVKYRDERTDLAVRLEELVR